ncbi:olfactory receptor 52P1-like [Leptodactylus fuscus]|uniref:olfactory receptor 52P1-like n=1 Tax=Leptodactylus fuscus TaxID=238119 RepID=UPI003F4F089E
MVGKSMPVVITTSTMNLSLPSYFILVGVPGLEDVHGWLSLPVSFMYFVTLFATFCVLFIIKTEPNLHQPMYFFLAMLLFSDLVQSNSTIPKMLLIFWFNNREISLEECLAQMFLVHSSSIMGSSVLLAMAFDRYVAVCHPLRYLTILTTPVIIKIGLLVAMRGILFIFPHPFLVKRLPFCQSHTIEHTYCEHIAVAKLSCADISINNIFGLFIVLSVTGVDLAFITVSYTLIVKAVLRLSSREARHKVGSTCVTHVTVILVAYIPALFSFMSQRFGGKNATSTQIILSNLYLIVPPMLNPIIYGIKTKEIQKKVMKILNSQRARTL